MTFEKKFGWTEVIALFALIISIVSAWYSHAQVVQNLPDLQFDPQPAIRIRNSVKNSDTDIAAIMPFIITNRGGRAATLVKLERDSIPPILLVKDEKIEVENDVVADFSFLDKNTNSKNQLIDVINSDVKPLVLPQIINESIESGKSRTFVLFLKFRHKNGMTTGNDKILFSVRAVFSDGTTFSLAQGLGYPQEN